MAIINRKEWDCISICIMIMNILILNLYQYNFIFISLLVLKQNIGIKLEQKIFPTGGEGRCLIMAMSTGACWGGHFVSNWAFLCRTGLFCVEPCIFLSNRAFLCRTSVIIRDNLHTNKSIHYTPSHTDTVNYVCSKCYRDKTDHVTV